MGAGAYHRHPQLVDMRESPKAYLTGFQNDLVISDCHLDNQPLGADQVRWIDFFRETLEKLPAGAALRSIPTKASSGSR